MNFYRDCFGGELNLIKISDTPAKDNFPKSLHNKIMHARLEGGLVNLSASDWLTEEQKMSRGNGMRIALSDLPVEELATVFQKLQKTAMSVQPLEKQFFGTYGSLIDQNGVGWMFVGNDGGQNPA